MLYEKSGVRIIIQLSQNDDKLPLPQLKQDNYPVIPIRVMQGLTSSDSNITQSFIMNRCKYTDSSYIEYLKPL